MEDDQQKDVYIRKEKKGSENIRDGGLFKIKSINGINLTKKVQTKDYPLHLKYVKLTNFQINWHTTMNILSKCFIVYIISNQHSYWFHKEKKGSRL